MAVQLASAAADGMGTAWHLTWPSLMRFPAQVVLAHPIYRFSFSEACPLMLFSRRIFSFQGSGKGEASVLQSKMRRVSCRKSTEYRLMDHGRYLSPYY